MTAIAQAAELADEPGRLVLGRVPYYVLADRLAMLPLTGADLADD